jgi:segregation and condensation protein B
VAYHEPVSRADRVDPRRQITQALSDVLMERAGSNWRAAAKCRTALIYDMTIFLDHFGLQSRRVLPGIDGYTLLDCLIRLVDAFDDLLGSS